MCNRVTTLSRICRFLPRGRAWISEVCDQRVAVSPKRDKCQRTTSALSPEEALLLAARQRALTVAESYTCLCLVLAGFLEHHLP